MNGRRPAVVTAIVFVLGVTADLLVGYSPFPGYGAALGLGGCTVILVLSKWLGKRFLQRPETYYLDEVPEDLQEDLRG